MALKGVSFPGPAHALNTIFVDDRYGTAVGTALMDHAPVLAGDSRPIDYCRDFDDFTNFNATTAEVYTITLNSGTFTISTSVPHGVISLATAAVANAESSLQKVTVWNLHATKALYFACKFNKTTSATVGGFLIGLTIVDATPAAAVTDGIYFLKADATAVLSAVTQASSTATTTATSSSVVADTNIEVGMIALSTSVGFYVNGVLAATHTTNIPATTVDLRVNLVPRAAAAGTASTILVDYNDTFQARTV